jgi:hypothetical protein
MITGLKSLWKGHIPAQVLRKFSEIQNKQNKLLTELAFKKMYINAIFYIS